MISIDDRLIGSSPRCLCVIIPICLGCRVEARAEVMDVFRQWHVAYHGTTVGNVRHILDCGELMFRGK